ncbi:MAG: hypothetical protein PHS74_05815 [Lachnospiraceae bacterium]|nr:hypothetical protein [Lachnospiraceae bacterium]
MKNIKEVNKVIVEFLGHKAKIMYIDSTKNEAAFMLYDSFLFKFQLDENHNTFGCGLEFSDGMISKRFLGKDISLDSDEKSIKESLKIIDDYCRLRLPDKFLDSYYKAYVTSQYEDCDL